MHSVGIPEKLWAEITATATYLRNRLPSKVSHDKTPYELWRGKKPNVQHLRIIWSDAYAHIAKRRRKSKLSARANKLKLIGYDEERKAYRLWNPDEERIEISRDVIFDEIPVLHHVPIIQGTEAEYYVNRIVDERTVNDKVEYLDRKSTRLNSSHRL